MRAHRAILSVLVCGLAFGQAVNPGRVNVVTTPWSVNWLSHANDTSALTDLGYSAWERGLVGSTDLVDWLATGSAGAPLVAIADDPNNYAVARTLQLDSVVDVRWFGAVADDGNDDSAAIQAAIDYASHRTAVVYMPGGVYDIATPLVPRNYGTYRGEPNDTVLRATLANTDAIWKWPELFNARFEGFVCRGLNNDANAFEHTDLTEYTAYCAWRDIEVYKELHTGIVACVGSVLLENCVFGYRGTAGAVWQPIDFRGGDASTNIFTPVFKNCRFYWSVGGDAAVELATGWNPIFIGCIFERLATPAISLRGVLGASLTNCNFEHISPGGTYNSVVYATTDSLLSQGSTCYWYSCKIQNNSGTPWTALGFSGSASGHGFEGTQGNMNGGYYTVSSGPVYDVVDKLYFRRHDRVINRGASGVTASAWTGQTAQFGGTVRMDGDAFVTDLVDNTNTDITYSVKTLTKSIDVDDDASTDDYQFDDDVANMTEQVIALTNALPAYATLIDWHVRCIETVTGSASMQIDVGTSSGGSELGTGSPDTTADLLVPAAGGAVLMTATNTARTIYFSGTPGVNWDTLNQGRWVISLTYIDYAAARTQTAP
jgi:hypothetical protein